MKKYLSILLLAVSPVMMPAYEQEEIECETLYQIEAADERDVAAEEHEIESERQRDVKKSQAKKYESSKRLKKTRSRIQARENLTQAEDAAAAEFKGRERQASPSPAKTKRNIRSGRSALQAQQPVADSEVDELSSDTVTPKKYRKTPQGKSKVKGSGKVRSKISHKAKANSARQAAQQRQRYIQRKKAAVRAQADASPSHTAPVDTDISSE